MQCCLSQTVPIEPVVARTSGCLFEKSLIEKYVDENGRCPVTGEPLSREDLIPVRPATPSATAAATGAAGAASIPGLLKHLHVEWEAMALEQFSLRQQLAQSQQELAHALQQYEAACAVIARLTEERETARGGLAPERSAGAAPAPQDEEDEDLSLAVPAALAEAMDAQETVRRQERKEAKKHHKSLVTAAAKQAAKLQKLAEPHTFLVGGEHGYALSVACSADAPVLYAAGSGDHHVLRYDVSTHKVTHSGVGHTGAVHTVLALPATFTSTGAEVLSASADGTVRLWQASSANALTCTQTLRYAHDLAAVAHELLGQQYLLAVDANAMTVSDLARGEHVAASKPFVEGSARSLTSVEVHPYGTLAGVGTQRGELILCDVRRMGVDTVVPMPKDGAAIASLAFHGDCLTIATGLSSGETLLWDLRNVDEPVATIPAPVVSSGKRARSDGVPAIARFQGPHSAFLAVAGAELHIYDTAAVLGAKEASALSPLFSHAASRSYTGVSWGPDARYVAACELSGVVELYDCV